MAIKFFSNDHCPNCPPAKAIVAELEQGGISVEYIDTDSVDGMVECSLHMVQGTPTTIVIDKDGNEVESWRGQVPDKSKILELHK
jgi:hypothetical protein